MPTEDALSRLLKKIALISYHSPRIVLGLVGALTIVAFFIAKGLDIDPALQSLIPEDRPAVKDFVETEQDFKHTEFMISVIELPPELPVIRYRRFLREYQNRLERIPELDAGRLHINSRFVRNVKEYIGRHGLLLMDEGGLKDLDVLLSPETLEVKLNASDPYRPHLWKKEFDPLDVLPLVRRMIPLADRTALDRSNEFFLTRDPHILFFVVGNDYPWLWDRTKKIVESSAEIERQAWNDIMPEVKRLNPQQTIPEPKIEWIGKAMDVMRMTQVIWEAFSGTIVSTSLLVALVFLCFLPSLRALCLAYLPVMIGLVWSLAFARLAVGKLNILSVVCWGLMIGLGIDFPTYLLNRYIQLRREGQELKEAVLLTWAETGRPVLVGALNVIIVFIILTASGLPAFRDIGLICSSGLFLILVLVLLTLPALIRLLEGKTPSRPLIVYPPWLSRIPVKRPWMTLLVSLLVFGGLSLFVTRFRFQSPFEETYFMFRQPSEIMSPVDRRFGELMGASINSFRLIVSGSSWEEALENNEALAKVLQKYEGSKEIAFFDSLSYWLPSEKRQERALQELPHLENLKSKTFLERYQSGVKQFLSTQEVHQEDKAAFRIYGEEVSRLLQGNVLAGPEALNESGLEKILNHYSAERDGKILLSTYVYLPRGNPAKLKEALMRRLLQEDLFRSGLVRYPSDESMIGEIRAVLQNDLLRLGGLSLVFTTVLLYFAFRSVKMTLYASVPMILGGLAAVGAYTLIRGDFSIFNILWVPIYIGMATDDALHIGSHLTSPNSSIQDALGKAGSIVILTSVTTMIGFGSSLFTEIEILKRISFWIVTALTTELIASLFLFPALLKIDRRIFSKKSPAALE